jgi:hypothetical protein
MGHRMADNRVSADPGPKRPVSRRGRMELSSPLGESRRLGRTAVLADVTPCRFYASTEPH